MNSRIALHYTRIRGLFQSEPDRPSRFFSGSALSKEMACRMITRGYEKERSKDAPERASIAFLKEY
jgi:hypothetical protein